MRGEIDGLANLVVAQCQMDLFQRVLCPIVLYKYQPSRKAEHAENFLKDFSGWLHADSYQGYHKLPNNIRVVGCWAQARRKFDKELQMLPNEKRQGSPAAAGTCYYSRWFQLVQSLVELAPEEGYSKRLELEKPVLDTLLAWADEANAKTAPSPAPGSTAGLKSGKNGLAPYRYLVWLLHNAPGLSRTNESWATSLLPVNAL